MMGFDDFDKQFDKQFKRTTKAVWTMFIINAVVGLGIVGVIAYVAIHFLKKIW